MMPDSIASMKYSTAAPIIEPLGLIFCGEKTGDIAERSWIFPPQMIVPSVSIFSEATVVELKSVL
jgi:hypothetical protein